MTFKIILFNILITVFLISCGIEVNTPVLSPPGRLEPDDAADYFQFAKLVANSEIEFRGFELYYKFYESSSEGSILLSNESNIESIDEMDDYGYRRITRYKNENDADTKNDTSYPLIKIEPADRNDYSVIRINFSDLANANVEGGFVENNRLGIRRAVLEPDDSINYKSFDDVTTDDADLKHLDSIEGNVVLSVYVFSFGRKDASTELYSEAVHLSSIQLFF